MTKTSNEEWDRRFMKIAAEASTWSKDPSVGVGAVVVSPDRRCFSIGYNGLPRDFDEKLPPGAILPKEQKNRLTLHAEDNAIAQAPFPLLGASLYTTRAPCLACAIRIHRAGIKTVISRPILPDSRWLGEMEDGREFLSTMGVAVVWVRGP